MPYDVVVGPFNPLALPVVLDFEPPKALGRAVFDVAYEGAPGCVHGAVLAATFDIILTAANAIVGATGPTVRLALRYRRPTLTGEEAVFEGWVTEVTDRRVFSKGRIVQGGIVTVEAEGEFAIFNNDGSRQPDGLGVPAGRGARRRAAGWSARDQGRGSGRGGRRRRRRGPDGGVGSAMARQSLQPSRDPADYDFTHRLRTRFAETDAMGIIHHAAYLPYLEEARVAYLQVDRASLRRGAGGERRQRRRRTGLRRARGIGAVPQAAALRRRGRRVVGDRRRHGHDVPDRLPPVVGRRGAGHRGDRARMRRRSRPAGAVAGVGRRTEFGAA